MHPHQHWNLWDIRHPYHIQVTIFQRFFPRPECVWASPPGTHERGLNLGVWEFSCAAVPLCLLRFPGIKLGQCWWSSAWNEAPPFRRHQSGWVMVLLQIYETSGHMAESGLKSIIHSPSTFLCNAMGKFQHCHICDGWLSHACACQLRFPVKGAVIHAAAWGTQSGNVACYYDGTFPNELKQLGYHLFMVYLGTFIPKTPWNGSNSGTTKLKVCEAILLRLLPHQTTPCLCCMQPVLSIGSGKGIWSTQFCCLVIL